MRSSYSALRNLSAHNISVVVADTCSVGMCQFSRLISGKAIYRSHYQDELGFIEDINEICERYSINYILPSHNETEILAKYRHLLDDQVCRMIPDVGHCILFNDKASSYDYVRSLDIPVPRRFDYESIEELTAALPHVGNFVIKMRTGNSAKGVYYADNPVEVIARVNQLIEKYELSPNRYPQIEERVIGEGWGCSALFWHGEHVADFTHRRLREKVSTGGTSTLREAAVHEGLREAALRIFSSQGWHGLAMCEFKVCPKTGKFWFIEVNPRMWGSISLAINSGVEFPYLSWLCAAEGPVAARQYLSECVRSERHRARWLFGDVLMSAKSLMERKVLESISTLTERADSVDDFYWDDPLAFVGEVAFYFKSVLGKRSLNPEEKGMVK